MSVRLQIANGALHGGFPVLAFDLPLRPVGEGGNVAQDPPLDRFEIGGLEQSGTPLFGNGNYPLRRGVDARGQGSLEDLAPRRGVVFRRPFCQAQYLARDERFLIQQLNGVFDRIVVDRKPGRPLVMDHDGIPRQDLPPERNEQPRPRPDVVGETARQPVRERPPHGQGKHDLGEPRALYRLGLRHFRLRFVK